MIRLPRRLAIWGGAAAVAVGGFAFMASNSVGASYAGEGSQAVSGYTVYDVTYSGVAASGGGSAGTMTFSGSSPVSRGLTGDGIVNTVTFKVSPDNALWSEVQLYDHSGHVIGGGGATNCKEAAGTWTCQVTGVGANVSTGVPVSQISYIDVEAAH